MYHVYEHPGATDAGRLEVLSDDDWRGLTAEQRAGYALRQGGFRTGLEAVLRMLDIALGGNRDRPEAACRGRRTGLIAV